MSEKKEYKDKQIIRKDAKGCFVESLKDYFEKGRAHLVFAAYDVNLPPGQRQTSNINIFIGVDELQEICRKITGGEMRFLLNQRKQAGDYGTPMMEWLGGTSAAKLAQYGRARADGMSLSRTAKVLAGKKTDILFIADSGPGEQNQKGLIVPRFGKNPENHVTVSMTFDSFSELFLLTKEHYQAWLSAHYLKEMLAGKSTGDAADDGWQSGEWLDGDTEENGQMAPAGQMPTGQTAKVQTGTDLNTAGQMAGHPVTAGQILPTGGYQQAAFSPGMAPQTGNAPAQGQIPVQAGNTAQGYPAQQQGNVIQMQSQGYQAQPAGNKPQMGMPVQQSQQRYQTQTVYQQAPLVVPQQGGVQALVQQPLGQYKMAS